MNIESVNAIVPFWDGAKSMSPLWEIFCWYSHSGFPRRMNAKRSWLCAIIRKIKSMSHMLKFCITSIYKKILALASAFFLSTWREHVGVPSCQRSSVCVCSHFEKTGCSVQTFDGRKHLSVAAVRVPRRRSLLTSLISPYYVRRVVWCHLDTRNWSSRQLDKALICVFICSLSLIAFRGWMELGWWWWWAWAWARWMVVRA